MLKPGLFLKLGSLNAKKKKKKTALASKEAKQSVLQAQVAVKVIHMQQFVGKCRVKCSLNIKSISKRETVHYSPT